MLLDSVCLRVGAMFSPLSMWYALMSPMVAFHVLPLPGLHNTHLNNSQPTAFPAGCLHPPLLVTHTSRFGVTGCGTVRCVL